MWTLSLHRSSRSEEFCKNDALKSFAKFTWKRLCKSLYIKLQASASTYFSYSGKVLVSVALLSFAWKSLEKMSELFLITLVGILLFWVAFEASKASILLQISSIVNNLKKKAIKGRGVARIWNKSLKISWKLLRWWRHTDILDDDVLEEN